MSSSNNERATLIEGDSNTENEPKPAASLDRPRPAMLTSEPSEARRRRQRRSRWMFGALLVIAVVLPIVALLIMTMMSPRSFGNGGCMNQDFAASFLVPDLTYGILNLTQARAIDLAWNLVIGRIGPFLLAILSYRVGADTVTGIAEKSAISYNAHAALTLNTGTWTSAGQLCKAIPAISGGRVRTKMTYLLFSAIFLLALPTLADLETGYKISLTDVWTAENGTLHYNDPCSPGGETIPNCRSRHSCIESQNFQWGFSSVWIIIIHSLLVIWAGGLYWMWIDAGRESMLTRKGRKMGTWRAVADLGQALRRDFGDQLDFYSEAGLKKYIADCEPLHYFRRLDHGQDDKVVLVPRTSPLTSICRLLKSEHKA